MLHLSPRPHHSLLSRPQPNRRLEFSPIPVEDDELLQAIEADHQEPWRLDPTPDSTELGKFWSSVEEDLHNDPSWVSFSDDGA